MKSREAVDQEVVFKEIYTYLQAKGFAPELHVMDNESSSIIKNYVKNEQKVKLQFVEPNMHRVNAAERAIQTHKNHLVAGLCTADKNFPMQLWNELLLQSEITLNLLRSSRKNPKLSAYAHPERTFNFNKTPLAPPGTKALFYVPPATQETWGTHTIDAWYVGPALNHYRNWRFWISETKKIRIGGTAKFLPTHCTMPTLTVQDEILKATKELIYALGRRKAKNPISFLPNFMDSIKKFAKLFQQHTKKQVDSTEDAPAPGWNRQK